MDVVADRIERVHAHALHALERQVGDAIRHVPEVAARRHAIHGSVDRRRTHRRRRQAEQVTVAFGDQLGGQLRDAVEPARHHVAVLRQRFARAIRTVVLVDGTRADVDESLEPRQRARPVEDRHRAHDVDVDDPAGSSASGSRFASAAVPRDRGVTVAPWTMCVMSLPASASRQVSGRVTSATTTLSRSATGAK